MKAWLRQPIALSLGIGLLVFLLVAGARHAGWLQRGELALYDALLRARQRPAPADDRIAIIGLTEIDLARYGHPLTDEQLAQLIEQIRAARPRAIGLDLYRNLPEPRNSTALPRLEAALRETPNLVAIFTLEPGAGRIPPPPALAALPDRIAFNDLPLDENVMRRALLYAQAENGETYPSLALRLALLYLEPLGITEMAEGKWLRLGKTVFPPLEPNFGGYVGADTRGYQMLMDFKGPTAVRWYSYGDMVEGRVPPEALRDRIIFIGTHAESVKDDDNATPLERRSEGVALHAQVINQLLRSALLGDRPMRAWPEPAALGWMLLWAGLGVLAGVLLIRFPWRAPLCFLGLLATLTGGSSAAFFHDWWLPLLAPALCYLATAMGSLGLIYYLERRERGELMQLFSRHVSETVARELWNDRAQFLDGHRPRSQKLPATVLFTDFVGFSAVSEHFEPVALLEWLNSAMETLADQVEHHHGIVVRYMGDALMAAFGVPVPHLAPEEIARDAQHAVRCALAMAADLERLNGLWGAEGRPRICMRIGIYSGPVVAGCIGSLTRLEFTVTGNTVNTAAHLEATKKEEVTAPLGSSTRILIGESTYELLGDKFAVEFVMEEALKNQARRTKIFRVLAECSENTPAVNGALQL